MQPKIYPLTFQPVLKDYLWGGRNLETRLGRKLPPGVIAESWEIAGHPDGTSIVENGHFAGRLLTDVYRLLGRDLIGRRSAWAHERDKFPLLVKLLDANRPLSVQVHPDDGYALQHEGNELGKTEMWVVLHAEPDAKVILGVKPGTTVTAFKDGILTGKLERYLHEIPVQSGDHICVPAGSVHAIMDGVLIAEIQQNSNTTYRVYDWNRVGADGQPRELHIEKALQVINFDQVAPALHPAKEIEARNGIRRFQLCRNRYFVVERLEMQAGSHFTGNCDGETLEIWGATQGAVLVQSEGGEVALNSVRFALLPAVMGKFQVTALPAGATVLRTYVAAAD